ncbi:MAG TPA: hypothetical protein VMT16_15170 [Thermoanaerobaculia bacterium]|nr:hypothetical protein [Thermoanaerobaculia bacterium]
MELESASLDRGQVAWIRFAGEDAERDAPAPGPAGGGSGGQDSAGGGDAPPPLPAPPPGGYAPTGEPEVGPLWTGTAEASWVDHPSADSEIRLATTIDPVRLRELRYPLLVPSPDGSTLQRVGTYLDLRPEGTVFTTQSSITVSGCSHSGSGL